MFQENNITIYTDGSSRGNPGRGGFASILAINNNRVIELGGKDIYTTNNKMELSGVIEGLRVSLQEVTHGKDSKNITHIKVYSDSKYVLNGITVWIKNWKKNNWKTAAKKAVLNQELWQEMDMLVEKVSSHKISIEWNYVKGHADNRYNNRADIIATTCADLDEDELADKKTKIFFDGTMDKWINGFDK